MEIKIEDGNPEVFSEEENLNEAQSGETPAEEIKTESGQTDEAQASGKEPEAESCSDESEDAGDGADDPEKEPEDAGEGGEGPEEKEEPEEEGAEPEETAGQPENQEPEKEGGLKGFFNRGKKKDKKDQQIEDLTDRVKRTMAEFDNFRKRTDREKAAMFENGARSVIEKILPVVDNFERGLESGQDHADDPYVEGMQKIYKQLMTVLDGMDVKVIEAQGQQFDPNFHNAVMHVDDEALGENVVAEVLQKGYTYRGTVVRHSMVKVAN